MYTTEIVSMTDVRANTKKVMSNLRKTGSGIVVNNNKPVFIIVTPEKRDKMNRLINAQQTTVESIGEENEKILTGLSVHKRLSKIINKKIKK